MNASEATTSNYLGAHLQVVKHRRIQKRATKDTPSAATWPRTTYAATP